ncbi:Hypothetical predicted protein, partial [Olea europaea subsp. europaea]
MAETTPKVVASGSAAEELIPKLSTLERKYGGNIPPAVMAEYITKFASIPTNTPGYADVLADYLATQLRLESDKVKFQKGMNEVDNTIVNLPQSNVTTVKLNEL